MYCFLPAESWNPGTTTRSAHRTHRRATPSHRLAEWFEAHRSTVRAAAQLLDTTQIDAPTEPIGPADRVSGSGTLTLAVSRTFSPAVFEELTGDPVSGLGDEAVLDTPSLHVRSGETYFNLISGGFVTEDPAEEAATGWPSFARMR